MYWVKLMTSLLCSWFLRVSWDRAQWECLSLLRDIWDLIWEYGGWGLTWWLGAGIVWKLLCLLVWGLGFWVPGMKGLRLLVIWLPHSMAASGELDSIKPSYIRVRGPCFSGSVNKAKAADFPCGLGRSTVPLLLYTVGKSKHTHRRRLDSTSWWGFSALMPVFRRLTPSFTFSVWIFKPKSQGYQDRYLKRLVSIIRPTTHSVFIFSPWRVPYFLASSVMY